MNVLFSPVLDLVLYQVPHQVSDLVPDQVPDQVPDLVPDQVFDQISDQVPDLVNDQVPDLVTDQVPDQVSDQISDQVPGRIHPLKHLTKVPYLLEQHRIYPLSFQYTGIQGLQGRHDKSFLINQYFVMEI